MTCFEILPFHCTKYYKPNNIIISFFSKEYKHLILEHIQVQGFWFEISDFWATSYAKMTTVDAINPYKNTRFNEIPIKGTICRSPKDSYYRASAVYFETT